MLRTVLPALAHAVVMNSLPTVCQEGTAEKLKAALQVYFGIIFFFFYYGQFMLFYYSVYFCNG
jgi:hypothetical protein